MRRNYVASTSVRRHFDVMYLLGWEMAVAGDVCGDAFIFSFCCLSRVSSDSELSQFLLFYTTTDSDAVLAL